MFVLGFMIHQKHVNQPKMTRVALWVRGSTHARQKGGVLARAAAQRWRPGPAAAPRGCGLPGFPGTGVTKRARELAGWRTGALPARLPGRARCMQHKRFCHTSRDRLMQVHTEAHRAWGRGSRILTGKKACCSACTFAFI